MQAAFPYIELEQQKPTSDAKTREAIGKCLLAYFDSLKVNTPDPPKLTRALRRLSLREGQPVERRSVPLRIDTPAQPLGHGGDGRVHTPDHRLWR